MPDSVFWDTAAFLALVNADDELHQEAVQVNDALALRHMHMVTTSAVLTEAVNSYCKVALRNMAQAIVTSVQDSVALGAATLVDVDTELWMSGWRLFLDRPDKDWSLTDCISFQVMGRRNLKSAFTSDHHFAQAGFEQLLNHP